MNIYPITDIAFNSQAIEDSGIRHEATGGGTLKTSERYETPIYTLRLNHSYLTLDKCDQLTSFYEANRLIDVVFPWYLGPNKGTYVVRFASKPLFRYVSGIYSAVTVNLIGYKSSDDTPDYYGYLLFDDGGMVLLPDGGGIRL